MIVYLFTGILGTALLLFLFIYLAATAGLVRSVEDMAEGIGIVPVDLPREHPEFCDGVEECRRWAQAQGFHPVGCYRTHIGGSDCVFAAWKHETRPTHFIRYHAAGRVFYDFATQFLGNVSLSTGSTQDAHTLPKPCGEYAQSFDGTLDELLTRHAAGEAYLMKEAGLQEQWVNRPLQELVLESVTRQALYVKEIPLWQLRGFWWYMLRRNKMHNRSVMELHESGLAPFPNEPGFRQYAP